MSDAQRRCLTVDEFVTSGAGGCSKRRDDSGQYRGAGQLFDNKGLLTLIARAWDHADRRRVRRNATSYGPLPPTRRRTSPRPSHVEACYRGPTPSIAGDGLVAQNRQEMARRPTPGVIGGSCTRRNVLLRGQKTNCTNRKTDDCRNSDMPCLVLQLRAPGELRLGSCSGLISNLARPCAKHMYKHSFQPARKPSQR